MSFLSKPSPSSFGQAPLGSQGFRCAQDVPYRGPAADAQACHTLDVYYSGQFATGATGKSPVIFLHGGNWRGGDKSALCTAEGKRLPQWFVERGHVFFAVNFRLFGQGDAGLEDMLDDVAMAIRWITSNGAKYGANKSPVTLVGYSSGAHLAALLATQPELLRRHRLVATAISTVIGLDVPFYDVPAAIRHLEQDALGAPTAKARLGAALEVMGSTKLRQRQVSPADRMGRWMRHVGFLLISAGMHGKKRQDISRLLSSRFCLRLRRNGNIARHQHFADLDHGGLVASFETLLSAVVEDFLSVMEADAERKIVRAHEEAEHASVAEKCIEAAAPPADNGRGGCETMVDTPCLRLAGPSQKCSELEIYYSGLPEGCAPEKSAVIFLHPCKRRGEAERALSTAELQRFAKWFVTRGHVFLSVKFLCSSRGRSASNDMLDDAACAIKWLVGNGRRHGLRSKQVTLVGFSSLAYLAALVASQPKLLRKHLLAPTVISAVIGLDMSPRARRALEGGPLADENTHLSRFNAVDLGVWMRHVKFLLISTGRRGSRSENARVRLSEDFTNRLLKNGNMARHEHFPNLSYGSSVQCFENGPGRAVTEFLHAGEPETDVSFVRQSGSARRRRSNVLKAMGSGC